MSEALVKCPNCDGEGSKCRKCSGEGYVFADTPISDSLVPEPFSYGEDLEEDDDID